ncbi:hypothetical protein ABZ345_46450 [Lentzea sp. NPDC005914]|uniref:hypothetical protein n=1 Tax=Lentzea sp. NPDC005914 TaxID=3154572 RepID=UPI0033D46577
MIIPADGDEGAALNQAHTALTSTLSLVRSSMMRLHESCRKHIEEITSELQGPMENVLALEGDFGDWLSVIAKRPEAEQLLSAHRDFGIAFYGVSSGLYRQAFSSLRSFIEVSVAAIYLSSTELKRRQWVSGKIDISWSALTSDDDGIYSKAYVEAFCPAALGEHAEMRSALRRCYRRCSEYVHGNVETSSLLPASIQFDLSVANEWLIVANDALEVVVHCLMVRYFGEFDADQRLRVEPALEGNFPNLASVRKLLGLPMEDNSK